MKFYEIDTVLDFGVYEGKTLKEALEIEANYLDYCLISVDDFCISKSILQEIKNNLSDISLSAEAEGRLAEKEDILSNVSNESDEYDEYDDEEEYSGRGKDYDDDYDEENGSYSRYGGGPTGELTDDFIDDVLGGEPDAYWNID